MTRKEAIIACLNGNIIGHPISKTTEWFFEDFALPHIGNFMCRNTVTDIIRPAVFDWHKDYFIIRKNKNI